MIKSRFSILSIILSAICILIVFLIDFKIGRQYLSSSGKTQALFGIVEILSFSYKYYFIVVALSSIIFSIIGNRKRENPRINWLAFGLSVVSLIIIFIPVWRVMILLKNHA